jgi:hypothetical protein
MPIRPLYRGFLRFLDTVRPGSDAWGAYQRHYLEPNRAVLDAAWNQCVGLDEDSRRARVRRVRPEHYAHLRELLGGEHPVPIVREALDRCREVLRMETEPTVDLLVGFFSPDGFVFRVGAEWEIGIGLERYRSWHLLPIVIVHEVAHWVRRRRRPEAGATVAERMAAEGLSVAFSQAVYPERPLAEHLRLSRQSLEWLEAHEASLWRLVRRRLEAAEPALLFGPTADVRSGREAPPRSWVYLGYRAVSAFLVASDERWPSEAALALPAPALLEASDLGGT